MCCHVVVAQGNQRCLVGGGGNPEEEEEDKTQKLAPKVRNKGILQCLRGPLKRYFCEVYQTDKTKVRKQNGEFNFLNKNKKKKKQEEEEEIKTVLSYHRGSKGFCLYCTYYAPGKILQLSAMSKNAIKVGTRCRRGKSDGGS